VLTVLWGAIYFVFTPRAEAFAQGVVLEILEEKGITPKAFADIQKKVDDIAKEQDKVADDVESVKTDIGKLKTQTDKIVTNQENAEKSNKEVKDSVVNIYNLLIKGAGPP
jgi:septal ring factor EnvC (AmiA/AmiB activator)